MTRSRSYARSTVNRFTAASQARRIGDCEITAQRNGKAEARSAITSRGRKVLIQRKPRAAHRRTVEGNRSEGIAWIVVRGVSINS